MLSRRLRARHRARFQMLPMRSAREKEGSDLPAMSAREDASRFFTPRKMSPSVFLVDQLFDLPNKHTIRLCIPGIDDGSGIWLEATIERPTRLEARELCEKVARTLQVRYERRDE